MTTGQVIVEVDRPGCTRLRLVLTEPLVIGRDCDGLLVDDEQVSRRHVELRPTATGVRVTDLDSTNGTTVDGERLSGSTTVAAGATIRLGSVSIQVPDTATTTARRPAAGSATVDARRTSIDRVVDSLGSGAALPLDDGHRHGTITIVFSDIESSTELTSTVGDTEWFKVLEQHDAIVRAAVARHGGTVVKHQGDGFMLVFPSARRALLAMTDVQRKLERGQVTTSRGPIRIRVGLHTGEAIVDDDGDLFGLHVNLAARVAGSAAGGEILVSSLTRAILETRDDIRFGGSRDVELKGISGVHQVHPVEWRELSPGDATQA